MKKEFNEKDFGRLVQFTLLAGVAVCLAFFAAGFALRLAGSQRSAFFFYYGALALLLTPAARVGMLIYGFTRSGERGLALASVLVLATLAVSVLL